MGEDPLFRGGSSSQAKMEALAPSLVIFGLLMYDSIPYMVSHISRIGTGGRLRMSLEQAFSPFFQKYVDTIWTVEILRPASAGTQNDMVCHSEGSEESQQTRK